MTTTTTTHVEPTAIHIRLGGGLVLHADVATPPRATGVVLFAHGSGSSRFSPRNRFVAAKLNECHIATVLADLLTPEEEAVDGGSSALRFDIPLVTRRVVNLCDWLATYDLIGMLPIGLFGASTGAAAALDAAAARPKLVRAVVSRGGRPDLATQLRGVQAPTLLIVGSRDGDVLDLNRHALRQLTCTKELTVIAGASHLFEEPGTLDAASDAAAAWFERYLVRA